MLWKYKRIYQETNEDVVDPTICVKLISAQFSSVILPPEVVDGVTLDYTFCDGKDFGQNLILNGALPTIINKCIQLNTLSIEGELTNLTIQQVSNAIANNNGLINVPLLDTVNQEILGSTTLIFGNCTVGVQGAISSQFAIGQSPDNLPQDPCAFNLDSYVFIFQTIESDFPQVNDIVCLSNNINNTFNGQGHWYKIRKTDFIGSTFVKINEVGVITQNSYIICST
jgi:hypothetical protein